MKKRKIFRKAVLVTALALLMLAGSVLGVSAYGNTSVTPRWVGIGSVELVMGFPDLDGTATGLITKHSTASLMEATLTVYKWENNDWQYIGEDYGQKTRGSLAVAVYFDAVPGMTYKAVLDVTAYTDGIPESETFYLEKVCP